MLSQQQARRVQVLAGQLGPPSESGDGLALEPTAARQTAGEDGYSVVLPETLTSNNWVVRRQVSGRLVCNSVSGALSLNLLCELF
jgi:hypothetical protein